MISKCTRRRGGLDADWKRVSALWRRRHETFRPDQPPHRFTSMAPQKTQKKDGNKKEGASKVKSKKEEGSASDGGKVWFIALVFHPLLTDFNDALIA